MNGLKGQEFRRLAEEGCRVYGDDPWFFLRELAQNARDAGATRIEISTEPAADGSERISFADDGTGMSFQHARSFFFRLFASSKEADKTAAGMYGIGFWSVLRFEPDSILVESSTGADAWAVKLDARFNAVSADCSLDRQGTRITLLRTPRMQSRDLFVREVRDGVDRYCRYLRRNDRACSELPVFLDGANASAPLALPGPMALSFRYGAVEGSVGLGKEPQVDLLARGLPVWHGVLVDELSHEARKRPWKGVVAQGLSPVFLLNGNDLRVIFSRNAVVDDAALARVRRAAKRALSNLMLSNLAKVFPVSPIARIAAIWGRAVDRVRSVHPAWWYAALTALVTAVAVGWVYRQTTGEARPPTGPRQARATAPEGAVPEPIGRGGWGVTPALTPTAARATISLPPSGPGAYNGAGVEATPKPLSLRLMYDPPVPVWFKLLSASRYDPVRGLVPEEVDGHCERIAGGGADACKDESMRDGTEAAQGRDGTEAARGEGQSLSVSFPGPPAGTLVLPAPTGYSVLRSSIRIDSAAPECVPSEASGEWVLRVPDGSRILDYTCVPASPGRALDQAAAQVLTAVPAGLPWPPEIRKRLADAGKTPIAGRVAAAAQMTLSLVGYDDSIETARRYRDSAASDSVDWLFLVLQVGRGDCDVLNTVNALLLREMRVPSRLALGVVASDGMVDSPAVVHAWTEYWDGTWKGVDVSTAVPERPPSGLRQARATAPEGAGTAVPERPPSGAVPEPIGRGGWEVSVLEAVPVAAVVALALAWLFLVRGRRQETLADGAPAEVREMLAQAALSALVHPKAWSHAPALRFHRVLPLVGGRRTSIERARRLARSGKLFSGTPGNALTDEAVRWGNTVLDLSDTAFLPVFRALPGVVDLDRVERLFGAEGPVHGRCAMGDGRDLPWTATANPAEQGASESRAPGAAGVDVEVFVLANATLARCRCKVRCVPAPGLQSADFRDVDLSGLRLPAGSRWPRRAIAVNTSGSRASEWTLLFARTPELSVHRMLSGAVGQSNLLSEPEAVLRRVARHLLGRIA